MLMVVQEFCEKKKDCGPGWQCYSNEWRRPAILEQSDNALKVEPFMPYSLYRVAVTRSRFPYRYQEYMRALDGGDSNIIPAAGRVLQNPGIIGNGSDDTLRGLDTTRSVRPFWTTASTGRDEGFNSIMYQERVSIFERRNPTLCGTFLYENINALHVLIK